MSIGDKWFSAVRALANSTKTLVLRNSATLCRFSKSREDAPKSRLSIKVKREGFKLRDFTECGPLSRGLKFRSGCFGEDCEMPSL